MLKRRMHRNGLPVLLLAVCLLTPLSHAQNQSTPAQPVPIEEHALTSPQNTAVVAPEPVISKEEQPLQETFHSEKAAREEFTSSGYFFRVVGLLAFLLGGFYLAVKLWANKTGSTPIRVSQGMQRPVPYSPKTRGLLQSLLSGQGAHQNAERPQIISRTKLGPAKEIHIVQVGNRQLVIGSTGQQMTLLTEMGETTRQTNPEQALLASSEGDPGQIYQKYLTRKTIHTQAPTSRPPKDEEVVLLDDFEDTLE